jgi:hypothetical protein
MRAHETLTLDLTDDDLSFAIGLLRDRLPELVCPRAWGILIVEQDRRCETKGLAKFPIINSGVGLCRAPSRDSYAARCAEAAAPMTRPEGPGVIMPVYGFTPGHSGPERQIGSAAVRAAQVASTRGPHT